MAKKTWIKIKRGLLEPKHREKLGAAVWLYFHILDRTNWENGAIEEWKDQAAADETEFELRTVREHRRRLEAQGYILTEQKKRGMRIVVTNWTNPREYTGQVYNSKGDVIAEPLEAEGYIEGYTKGVSKHVTPTSDSQNHISHKTKGARAPSLKDEIRKYAQEVFEESTGLTVPPKQGEAVELWWSPLREICDLGGWQKEPVQKLIVFSVAALKKSQLTLSSPKSIIKTVRAMAAEGKQKGKATASDSVSKYYKEHGSGK